MIQKRTLSLHNSKILSGSPINRWMKCLCANSCSLACCNASKTGSVSGFVTCILLVGSIAWRIRRVWQPAIRTFRRVSSAVAPNAKSTRDIIETCWLLIGGVSRQDDQHSSTWDSHWQTWLVSRISLLSQVVVSMTLAGGAESMT